MSQHLKLFQIGEDKTDYRLVSSEGVSTEMLGGRHFLIVQPEAIARLTEEAFGDISHLLRPSHLSQLQMILDDPEASANDRFVATELLKNAVIAAARQFSSCQDTGTAIISGKKGQNVSVEGRLHDALYDGIERTWRTRNLRFSQMAPLSMFEEQNTGTSLPAQIDIEAVDGDCLGVQSPSVMVLHSVTFGGTGFGPDTPRLRPHDGGGASSDPG